MRRIVMERHETSSVDREAQSLVHGRVTPPDPFGVLPRRVLRVMDQQIGAVRDAVPRSPVLMVSAPRNKRRLMIWHVRDDRIIGLEPVSERRPRMAHQVRVDLEARNLESVPCHIMKCHPWQFAQEHREQRRRQVARQS